MRQKITILILSMAMISNSSIGYDKKCVNLLAKALKIKYGTQSVCNLQDGETADIALTVHFDRELTEASDVRLIGSTAVKLLYDDLGENEKKDIGSLSVVIETPLSRSDVMGYKTTDLGKMAWLLELDGYEAMCRHDGEISGTELIGFNFVEKTVAATAAGIPVFVAWFAVSHGNLKSEYQISIRMDTRQVVTLSIN